MEQVDYLRHIQQLKVRTLVFLLLMLAGFLSAGLFYVQLQKSKNDLAGALREKETLYNDMVASRAYADSINDLYKKLLITATQKIALVDTALAGSINKQVEDNRYAAYLVYLQQRSKATFPFSKTLQKNLQKNGFQAPGIETMNRWIANGIYYFHQEDKPVAEDLLEIVRNTCREAGYTCPDNLVVKDRTNIKAPAKQLEIWIDLER